MEGRTAVLLVTIIAFFVLSGIYGINQYTELEGQRRKLRDAQEQLASLKNNDNSNSADARVSKIEEELKVWKEMSTLNGVKNSLVKEVSELEDKKIGAMLGFKNYVLGNRPKMEGKEFAELQLLSGKKYLAVRVQKVNDMDISVSHSLGVSRIDGRDLPEDLQDVFRFGRMPTTYVKPVDPDSEEAKAAALAAANAAPVPAAPEPPRFDSSSTPAMKIQVDIDTLARRIDELQRHIGGWQSKARDFRSQASNAQIQGRPSYNFNSQADQAERQAQACSAEINKINGQIAELRKKQIEAGTTAP